MPCVFLTAPRSRQLDNSERIGGNQVTIDAVRLLDGATQQAARQQREDRREPGDKVIGKIPAGFRTLARHAAGFHYVPVASDDETLGCSIHSPQGDDCDQRRGTEEQSTHGAAASDRPAEGALVPDRGRIRHVAC